MNRIFRRCLFIALAVATTWIDPVVGNQRFDPFSDTVNPLIEDLTCTTPPYQNASQEETYLPPPEGACPDAPDDRELSPEELHQLAVAYAPVLFFHPLEQYTLQSVRELFRDPALGKIQERLEEGWNAQQVWDDTLNLTALLLSTRDPDVGLHASRFFVQRQLWEDDDDAATSTPFLYGAGFNASGYSNAVIYYNSFPWHNRTLVFNYYYFYSFRGFSGMALFRHTNNASSSLSPEPTQFSIPPYGAHASDWKTLSVMVCNSANVSEPLAVRYDQGPQQSQITSCTVGECVFYQNDTYHPVAFVALDSHAMYPVSSQMIVLEQLPADAFSNLQTVLHVDRTVYRGSDSSSSSPVRLFYPNSSNVLLYLPQNEIQLNTTDDENAWQGFGGRWGDFNLSNYENASVPFLPQDPICFNAEQTAIQDCPNATENAVFQLVLELLGVTTPSNLLVRGSRILFRSVLASLPTIPPRGPPTLLSYQSWLSQAGNAPIWQEQPSGEQSSNDTTVDTCTALWKGRNNTNDNNFVTPIIQVIALENNTVSLIVFCVIVMFINMVVFVLVDVAVHYQPAPFATSADGVPQPLGWPFYLFLLRLPIYFTLFYTGTMVAAVLFLSGYSALQGVLLKYLGLSLNGFRNAVFGCLMVLVIVDSLFLIVLWKQTHDTWYGVKSAYQEFTNGNHQFTISSTLDERNVTIQNTSSLAYRLVYAALFSCVIFAAVVAVFGSLNIGLAYGFGLVCTKTAKAASGVCFSLNVLDFKSISCGTEFQDFCNGFAQAEIVTTFWGSFLICAGHFYLISTASALSINFHTINALTNSWLSRCKELEQSDHVHESERPEEIAQTD
jgi:hypothetical protein